MVLSVWVCVGVCMCVCARVLCMCVLLTVPSRVLDVQQHCTVVVWRQPAETNGHITSYLLTFVRDQKTLNVWRSDGYHYYVLQPDDIPPGTGPVTVEV